MSVITFSKGSEHGFWRDYWIASSVRAIGINLYPKHPYPSVSYDDAKSLLIYFQKIYDKDSFYHKQEELNLKELYGDQVLWGIKFYDESDEAAFIMHVSGGIEIPTII